MIQRNLWKLILSFLIVSWAAISLFPLTNQPFPTYVEAQATTKREEFSKLLGEATTRANEKKSPSVFIALRDLANERSIDLQKDFFPEVRMEQSLKNIPKRNQIVLDHLLGQSKARLKRGLDLAGGVGFTLEADPAKLAQIGAEEREAKLGKAIEILGNRINGTGLTEPIIRPVGENRIEVQLPDVNTKDNPEISGIISKPARLDFRRAHPTMAPGFGVETPPGYLILTEEREDAKGQLQLSEIFVSRVPEATGNIMKSAGVRRDTFGKPEIVMLFTDEGRADFAAITKDIAEEGRRNGTLGRLAIVLDGKLYSAPSVREEIDSESAQITGQFSDREAFDLANALNNPLDVPLKVVEQYEVGPSLASDAVSSAKIAFIISTALTVLFILVFYTVGGVVAAIGMAVNVLVVLGVMASFEATLTMPGIAGIVLTLAMSVDSNILIFERMREELAAGKSLPAALEAGFEKAWSAILDSNVTTLIVAAVMIWLGNGPVKGFGVTLAIGIFTTMFAAVLVSKLLMEALILPGVLKRLPMFSVLQNTKIDFLKWAKPAFALGFLTVALGIGVTIYKGDSIYGVDFVGGDQLTVEYAQKLEANVLRATATQAGFKETAFGYLTPLSGGREVLKVSTEFDQGAKLVSALTAAHPEAQFKITGEQRIGPSVGAEIRWNALLALGASLLGILLYVAFRFEVGYGVGAIVATVHDILMTIGIFVLFDRQFNASMVAAILLIAGYSINDTIVVFDRIREELQNDPTASLSRLINRSLNLTLSRTIITGGTTFLSAITLIVVTTGEVNDIAFTLLIGVITGTFSSLFIAAPIFYWWHKGDRKDVEARETKRPVYEWDAQTAISRQAAGHSASDPPPRPPGRGCGGPPARGARRQGAWARAR
jgi:SecD/SecF fusion protein